MNRIHMELVKTIYDYREYYWMIDGRPIVRYVDEAVEIPFEFCDTKDAYLKYQFDAQFSGSDYARDPAWLKKREFLREHGAELVFLSYTESTSSTKIKEMINRKLL